MTRITLTEIAKKYEIHKGKLVSIITRQPLLKFPRPVGKKGVQRLYDDAAVAKFFEENPHKQIVWVSQYTPEKTTTLNIDNKMVLQFIRGEYSHESIQLENARRLIRARRRADYCER